MSTSLDNAIAQFYSAGKNWGASPLSGWGDVAQFPKSEVVEAVENAQGADVGDVNWVKHNYSNWSPPGSPDANPGGADGGTTGGAASGDSGDDGGSSDTPGGQFMGIPVVWLVAAAAALGLVVAL